MSHLPSLHQLHDRIIALTIALYRVTDYFPKTEILRGHLRLKANEIFERLMEHGNGTTDAHEELDALIHKIQTINGYLAIAHTMNYVRSVNIIVLEREYSAIEQFLHHEKTNAMRQQMDENLKHLSSALSFPSSANKHIDKAHAQSSSKTSDSPFAHRQSNDAGGERGRETWHSEKEFYEKGHDNLHQRHAVIIDHLKKSGPVKISDLYASFQSLSSKTIQRDLQFLVERKILKKDGEKRWTTYSLIA